MSYTLADLSQLEAALASGAKEVEYNDRRVKFHSIDDLKKAIQVVKQALGLAKRGSRLLCKTSKGTC